MCYNIVVSIFATLCHIKTLNIVKSSNVKYKIQYFIFLYFYIVMELFQTLQHITLPYTKQCGIWNVITTVIAYALIWIQPYLFYIMYYQLNRSNKLISTITKIIFVYAMLSLVLGFRSTATYVLPNSNFGPQTCTKIAENGNIEWMFKLSSIIYSPNFFIYLLFIGVISWEFPNELFYSIGLGWWISLVVSILWVGISIALPSRWCQLSIFVDIPIIFNCYKSYYKRY